MIWPLWRTAWGFLNKLRIKLPRNPAVPLVGIYPEETMIEKDTGTPGFIVALSAGQEAAWMAISRNCGTYTQGSITQP